MRVEVVVAGLDGKLPNGHKLVSPIGGMLLGATMKAAGGQESVHPFTFQGVTAVLVKTDLSNPARIVNLAFHGGEQLKLGEGDELVLQQWLVDALNVGSLLGTVGRTGVTLVASPQPVFNLFQAKAA